jgi:hypothetical protein
MERPRRGDQVIAPERTALAPKLRDLGGANLRADLEAPTWV